MITNKKIFVSGREEALDLIAKGAHPLSLFSEEAKYGYKKDGTPAGKRGRKATDSLKIAKAKRVKNSKRKNAGVKVVKTAEFPHGMKKDGTPAKKRGRPRKNSEASVETMPENSPEAIVEAGNKDDVVELPSVVEAANEAPVESVTEPVKTGPLVLVGVPVVENVRVQLVRAACVGEAAFQMRGNVSKVSDSQAFVYWDDGSADWRGLDCLEVIDEKATVSSAA